MQKVVSGLQDGLDSMHSNKEIPLRVAKKLFPTLSDQVIQRAVQRMLDQAAYPKSVRVDDAY